MRSRHRYQHSILKLGAFVVWLLISGLGFGADENRSLPDEIEKPPSNWINNYEVRGWSGYKDNLLLSNRNIVGSPLLGVGADLMFFRLPVNDWEASILATGEYIRYLDGPPQVDQEANVILQGQVNRSFAGVWKAGLSAEYMYFDQVFDGSAFTEVVVPVPIQGHSMTLRPSLAWTVGSSSRLELEFPVNRQVFNKYLDNFWEVGPKLAFIKSVGKQTEFGGSYQYFERIHDTLEARDAHRLTVPGRELIYFEHELAATWRQYWDEERHWRTTTKASLWRNDDNAGFYRYWRPQFSEQVRYHARTWEVRADARVSYYAYDNERIADLSSELREKAYLRLGLRGEKTLVKSLKVFGQYEYERAFSNLDLDRYTANTISVGLSWEF